MEGGRGPRRKSQRINELCNKFEPIGDGQNVHLDTEVRGKGVEGETIPSESGAENRMKNIIRIFGSDGQLVAENDNSVNPCSAETS